MSRVVEQTHGGGREMTVQLYQVGPDEFGDYEIEPVKGCVWLVYWYEIGDYGVYGEAVSFDGKNYTLHNLSHGFCYGPDDKLSTGDAITLDQLFGESVSLGVELHKETLDKIYELIRGARNESANKPRTA